MIFSDSLKSCGDFYGDIEWLSNHHRIFMFRKIWLVLNVGNEEIFGNDP